MSVGSSLNIVARLGERELPVRWAWFRPEPQVGDTVRLQTAGNGNDGWQSFVVTAKHLQTMSGSAGPIDVNAASVRPAIHLNVEPLAH